MITWWPFFYKYRSLAHIFVFCITTEYWTLKCVVLCRCHERRGKSSVYSDFQYYHIKCSLISFPYFWQSKRPMDRYSRKTGGSTWRSVTSSMRQTKGRDDVICYVGVFLVCQWSTHAGRDNSCSINSLFLVFSAQVTSKSNLLLHMLTIYNF